MRSSSSGFPPQIASSKVHTWYGVAWYTSSSYSYSRNKGRSCSKEGLEGGYNTNCFDKGPFLIVLFPALQMILELAVASQGLPRMRG